MPIFSASSTCSGSEFFTQENVNYISKCITQRIAELEIHSTLVVVPDDEILTVMRRIYNTRSNIGSIPSLNEAVISELVRAFHNHVLEEMKVDEWATILNDPFSQRLRVDMTTHEQPRLRGKYVGRDTSRGFAFHMTY